jgi:hypothetical protein
VAHRRAPSLSVKVQPAWAWSSLSDGRVRAVSPGGKSWEGSPEEFASAFVKENFE